MQARWDIAIILFGIMGTLEGKELAAFLGGLSDHCVTGGDGCSPVCAHALAALKKENNTATLAIVVPK